MKRKIKGIISLVLILTMSLAMFIPVSAAANTNADTKATALKQLRLFKGVSDTDFALDRAATRTEAIIMLIRALGKETEAINGSFTHPFTDVESWADKYIGYAYQNGLTKGVSATEFGTGNASSGMYLTFVLRALGYDDLKGDFSWESPDKLAGAVGILTSDVDTANFLRADVAKVTWAAVKAETKGGKLTLAKKLIFDKVFTADEFSSALALVNEQEPNAVKVSSAKELETALADSNVKAVAIDSIGNPVIVTGQLTIPAGITLTVNCGSDFHVEGTLINNGEIRVMGANAIVSKDFINYSVMSVQNGGKLINNGKIKLLAATLDDTSDNGPVGGQLRLNGGGTVENAGSLLLQAGKVNTHGGMSVVIEGKFTNSAIVIVDGFFLRIENGEFINSSGGTVINTSTILTGDKGKFTNNGKLSGNQVNG